MNRRAVVVTGICFLMAFFAWGSVFYGNGVYLVALHAQHGWDVGDISIGIGIFFIAGVPATIMHGALVDRYGPRWLVSYGALAIGTGLVTVGHVDHIVGFYLAMVLLGSGYPAMATPLISASLLPWFREGYGVALGLALTGASVGGALFVPILVFGIERYGLETTSLLVGGVVAFVVLALAQLGLRQPGLGETPRFEVFSSVVMRDAEFWRLSVGCALGLGVQVGYLMHQLAILKVTMPVDIAAYAVSAGVISSAVGRLVFGALARRVPLHWLTAIAYLVLAGGIAWLLLAWADWQRVGASVVAGFSVGAVVMLPALLVRHRFGPALYGRAYAAVNVALYTVAGIGPAVVGLITDRFGGYALALLGLVAVGVVGASVIAARSVKPAALANTALGTQKKRSITGL